MVFYKTEQKVFHTMFSTIEAVQPKYNPKDAHENIATSNGHSSVIPSKREYGSTTF